MIGIGGPSPQPQIIALIRFGLILEIPLGCVIWNRLLNSNLSNINFIPVVEETY